MRIVEDLKTGLGVGPGLWFRHTQFRRICGLDEFHARDDCTVEAARYD
jgi:hypothetical protein